MPPPPNRVQIGSKTHFLGWHRPKYPKKIRRYTARQFLAGVLPDSVDLRSACPPIVDQGNLGSCTANAIAGALQYDEMREALPTIVTPSRLFIYYNERVDDGTVGQDAGSSIQESVLANAKYGYCDESAWPYDIGQFTTKPSASCYASALNNRITDYASVAQDQASIQTLLAEKDVVNIGFTVYESFENIGSDGIMTMPRRGEQILGGHAVAFVGYQTIKGVLYFITRNSWGTSWGQKGYFYMPALFALDPQYADDFWVVRSVPGAPNPPTPSPGPTPPQPTPGPTPWTTLTLSGDLKAGTYKVT